MLPQNFTLHAQLLPFYQICMPSQVWSRACAYLSSEDSIRGAAASLVGSEVPASIESAAALDRDGRVARRKRSTLQVVRVTCLAARVGRDAAALALGGRVHSSQGACAAERQADMGLLDLVLLCGRSWWRLVLVGLIFFFCFFCSVRLPDAWSVAFFSFLTTCVDAPGEQSTSRCLRVREHLSLSGAAQVQEPKTPLTLARFNYRFKTFKMSRFVGTFKTYTVLTQVYSRAAVPLPLLVEYRPTFTPPSHPIIICVFGVPGAP